MTDATPPLHDLKLQDETEAKSQSTRPVLNPRTASASSLRAPAISSNSNLGGSAPGTRSGSPSVHHESLQPNTSNSGSSGFGLGHRGRTPMNSMLELKRFFGKGRKKHEHGVPHGASQGISHAAAARAPPSPSISMNSQLAAHHSGHSQGSGHSQAASHVSPTIQANHTQPAAGHSIPAYPAAESQPVNPIHAHADKSKHHSLSSIFGFHKHHKKDHEGHHEHKPGGALTPAPARNFGDVDKPVVLGKPPADLDPNFVVHGPDYEADWDPFHIFGLEPNSERMPFLESGITKYGQVGRDMGSGAGGSVRMMERPSDHKVFAVKEFRKRRGNESQQRYAKTMTAEYALGAALHHKNIIETIDLIKEGDKYYEVMEYGAHDFFELVMSGEMSTAQVNSSFRQIFDGVAYLHSMGVAHRDIKLDNCVVTEDGVVKLIDFGSAVIFRYPMSPKIHLARGILGSDPYLAPEVFERRPYQPQCADIWSCGIIYCCAYLRRFPWKLPRPEDSSYRKFAENPVNIDGEHPPQENSRKITGPWRVLRLLPRDSRHIIGRILTINVPERATIQEIYEDEWFKNIKTISVLPEREE